MLSRWGFICSAIALNGCGGQTEASAARPPDAAGNETTVEREAASSGGGSGGILLDASAPDMGPSACAPTQRLEVVSDPRDSSACTAAVVPLPEPWRLIPDHVNLSINYAGEEQFLYYLHSPQECASFGDAALVLGWWYDNRVQPTRFLFCPATCELINKAGGFITVHHGCSPLPPPLPE